jgi:regulator of protease activity HflC (stomatin/prohibitin superfamily)
MTEFRGSGRGPIRRDTQRGPSGRGWRSWAVLAAAGFASIVALSIYNACTIEVPPGYQAVLVRKAGLDLEPGMVLAPPFEEHGRYSKGVQPGVLTEGRYFYNPLYWSWEIGPQKEIPADKIGVVITLAGDDLPPGKVLAEPGQKGIQRAIKKPGRYAYNRYAEQIEEHDPIRIPPGFRGVVTLLAGDEPKDPKDTLRAGDEPKHPNVVLVGEGERGVQKKTLPPGLHYLNPYEVRVSLVDCRSRRFNLATPDEMSFLTSDGFAVVLDGAVEFRVIEEKAAEVFVLYNEDANGDAIDDEILAKIISPETRSICRINGSKLSGRMFFDGDARKRFQDDLKKQLFDNCRKQGIEVVDIPISSIQPPQEIARPVRARELAKQNLARYLREKEQQESEKQLKVETMLVEQGKKLVEAERIVGVRLTRAEQDQKVAVTDAEKKLAVARTRLQAARDEASAVVEAAKAESEVIRLTNQAEVAGIKEQVSAFDGDGGALARNVLVTKLAPAFRTILSNSEGPLMDLFGQFTKGGDRPHAKAPDSTAKNGELPSQPFSTAEVKP